MLRRDKLKALLVLLVLSILAVSFSIILSEVALGESLPRANYKSYLPLILFFETPPEPTPQPKPTTAPPPAKATVYVNNELGENLRFEILNTGIGRKTIPPGKHLYGSFSIGTYKYVATAAGQTLTKTSYYPAGITEITFYWQ
jgi:hypothetical protein